MTMKIIHEDCDSELAKNRDLPRNAYLVSYTTEDEIKYDIVCGLQCEIFDHYWDKYRNVRGIEWTSGTVNPKIWGSQISEKKKKK